jgi:hypothetical protein
VLCLETLLTEITPSLQEDFLRALRIEGFEITHGIPNLQLPQEIDACIVWLADRGFGDAWASLHRTLTLAAQEGTLVDLSFGAGGS